MFFNERAAAAMAPGSGADASLSAAMESITRGFTSDIFNLDLKYQILVTGS